ncbi:dihydrofolate reductase family protein [Microbacterium sp. ASV81]|uniref:Dihydrofolate reductase family protein n=1 Tax=Microbacterium capsulatum TaxID=3041921 RepID=A0ABU0XIN2_9MICO|nr:dihydrofolate reductase family protein [Microbacterium sp. ASV81]MDQ4214989.1 dihydrofolate reductase family protein [Microbacterium sp. ASV81]
MGRFVYWMNVSLDLRIEAAPGEDGSGDWMRIGEPLHSEFNARAREMALMIQGRRVFEIMERFWPAARDDASLPGFLREYGAIWTDAPKILVSRTRTEAPYNTRVIGEDAIARLSEVRASTEGAIGVGGATLATALLHAGLLDELLLFTHPVILGSGRELFDPPAPGEPAHRVQLDLLEQAAFDEGVTLHRYAVRR